MKSNVENELNTILNKVQLPYGMRTIVFGNRIVFEFSKLIEFSDVKWISFMALKKEDKKVEIYLNSRSSLIIKDYLLPKENNKMIEFLNNSIKKVAKEYLEVRPE